MLTEARTLTDTRDRVAMLVEKLLNDRGLTAPDGRALWKYGITASEHTELERVLRAFCAARTTTSLLSFAQRDRNHARVFAAFGLYTALWFQRHYLSGHLSYHLVLSELCSRLDTDEAREFGRTFAVPALDFWKVRAEHRQHQDLITLSSQGGVQLARLARSKDEGWGTLAPLKSVITQIAADELQVTDSFNLLNIQKAGLPRYYRSEPAIEYISTLIQWFWRATEHINVLTDEPEHSKHTRSLQDTQSEVENANYLCINDDLIAIYKLAFQEIEHAQARQKSRYFCDVLLEKKRSDESSTQWGIALNIRAPRQLDTQRSQSLSDHDQRVFLTLDLGDNHYQVAHYYRPYGGNFVRETYVQNTPPTSLSQLAFGAVFSISGKTVFELPPIPVEAPLVFEESARGYKYIGSYGTSLKGDTCLLLIPACFEELEHGPDYAIEKLGALIEENLDYRVLRISLPTQEVGTQEAKTVSVPLPVVDSTNRGNTYIKLRAPRTYSNVLIPTNRSSTELDFGVPTIGKTTQFQLGSYSFETEVSRESEPCTVDLFPHKQGTPAAVLSYGVHRAQLQSRTQYAPPIKVVVIPDNIRWTTNFGAEGLEIHASPSLGAVSIEYYGTPDTTYEFGNGELWSIPLRDKLSTIPLLRITFRDWEGQPAAIFRPISQYHSGFIERAAEGLKALSNKENNYKACAALAELPNILFTADPRASRRHNEALTLKAALRRPEGRQTKQLMQRYWTFNTKSAQLGPIIQLGDIVEQLRSMFRAEPHVDNKIDLTVIDRGVTHQLQVRQDFGRLGYEIILEHPVIRPKYDLEHPIVQRSIYAPAYLVLIENPSIVHTNINYDAALRGWRLPEGLVPGTYLFLTARELYRPLLIRNGTYIDTSDWADATTKSSIVEREEALQSLFDRYAEGNTDESVPEAIDSLLGLYQRVDLTAFEGLTQLARHPKALLRYLHVDHNALDKDRTARILQSFESLGVRWWTIPGYHWFEASLNVQSPINIIHLWPLVAQRSPLLARSLIRTVLDNEVDYSEYLINEIIPYTAQGQGSDERPVNDKLQDRLRYRAELEGTWSTDLVNTEIINHAPPPRQQRRATPTITPNLRPRISNAHKRVTDIAPTHRQNTPAPLRHLRAPRTEEIRQAMLSAVDFVVDAYERDQIITPHAMNTILPLRWLAPGEFDLLCALRLS